MALHAIHEAVNREVRPEQRVTFDEYLMWRLADDIKRDELRLLMDNVPGMRLAATQWARWEAERAVKVERIRRGKRGAVGTSKLAQFMAAHDISRSAVYSTGAVSRRRFYEIYDGTGAPNLSTMVDLTRALRELTGGQVEITDIFDLTVE
jgi:hypothetical protein